MEAEKLELHISDHSHKESAAKRSDTQVATARSNKAQPKTAKSGIFKAIFYKSLLSIILSLNYPTFGILQQLIYIQKYHILSFSFKI